MPLRSFDRIARLYRALEYLTFGPLLHRARLHYLPALHHSRHALVLGDGDGRFLAALLRSNPRLHALAVDSSPGMLALLARRTAPFRDRRTLVQADLRSTLVPTHSIDLVVTHFFLDCLTDHELRTVLARLPPHLTPGALWVLSDFRIPPRGPLRPLAHLLVRSLYLAFRLLTGLRVSRLPDHAAALQAAGLHPLSRHLTLGGILTAELWQLPISTPAVR